MQFFVVVLFSICALANGGQAVANFLMRKTRIAWLNVFTATCFLICAVLSSIVLVDQISYDEQHSQYISSEYTGRPL